MKHLFILFCMIFCHIVDDYYLQGWLASAKQKEWWEKNAPCKLYKNDYCMALVMHAFSWTFMMMLVPTLFLFPDYNVKTYGCIFFANWIVHLVTDDAKANEKRINLIEDQLIHIIQIVCTWIGFYMLGVR